MAHKGPIILVEDDEEDQLFIKEALEKLKVDNELIIFEEGVQALGYLNATNQRPFLILCDINMPKMNGLQLRMEINQSDYLRKKSIPFIFVSTAANKEDIEKAYDLTVQGYFQKKHSFESLVEMLKLIVDYWEECKHPNAFVSRS